MATTANTIPENHYRFTEGKGTKTLYFSSIHKTSFIDRIVLNANESELINNIAFMDHISPAYAPQGQSLVAVSIRDKVIPANANQEHLIRKELLKYYPQSTGWKVLAT